MQLKRLDIAGFKSFASRTSFEFGAGITAIVGPNGSGKSNIADALRWVLGEQAGRLIRVRRLDDVIFAGSTQRSPSARAEVSIVIDNSSGRLPMASPDVTITRRVQRNAETEYLLNRRKGRLRDIQELLMAASAGQTSYSIIGQGLVESILNLRAEERRQLIEEAADVQRFRLRIEEAQSKLGASRENMERVQLLIKEISPRLRQLEQQAKRALEHSRLSDELVETLRTWYEQLWDNAQEALLLSRASFDQAQADHTQARVALETCQRELSSIGEDVDRRRELVRKAADERQRLGDSVRELDQNLTLDRQRQEILQTRHRDLSQELKAIQYERDVAAANIFDDSERRAQLDGESATVKQALETHNQRLRDLEKEFGGAQGRVAAAEERAARLRIAAADLETRAQDLTSSQGELARESSRLERSRRSLVNQLAEAVRMLRSLTRQESQLNKEIEALPEQRQRLGREASGLEKNIATLEENQRSRLGKLEGLKARLQTVQEAQTLYRSQLKDDVDSEQAITVERMLATFHEVIRIPAGLEVAIEAAVADYIESLLVEGRDDAINAARAIIASNFDRTFVIPISGVKEVHPLNILRERGVLGVASRLVKCDPRYQDISDALLGRVIIVQDTEVAERVFRRGMGTVVTLDGIAFHPWGSISAGWPRNKRPTFVLGHQRDLESLPKEIERTQRSLGATEKELERLQNELSRLSGRSEEHTQELDALLGRRLQVLNKLGERRQTMAHLRGELRGAMSTLFRVRAEQSSAAERITDQQQERTRLLLEAEEAESAGQYLRKAIGMVEEQRDTILAGITASSSRLAILDGERQSLVELRQRSEEAVARRVSQIAAKDLQLHSLETELSSLASRLLTTESKLTEASERLAESAARIDPERETIAQSETRERELHSQLLTLQNRLLQSERRRLEAEAEARRWETELGNLRQHLEEDGLTVTAEGTILVAGITAPPHWPTPGMGETTGGTRPIAGGATVDLQELGVKVDHLRGRLRQMGPVNMEAEVDYSELASRHSFLSGQLEDLRTAEASLQRAIGELNQVMNRRFETTFREVGAAFHNYFRLFFGEGEAELSLSGDESAGGVEITARPTGKRLKSLSQLSGGEKALTAVAFLFALLQANPSPFCVLDEVDAMLDDANVERFVGALRELSDKTQFIVISHNRKTIEKADAIYGVSMGADNVSKVLSLRLAEISAG